MATLDKDRTLNFTNTFWEREILPTLTEYISIPCKSPAFDPNWKKAGHIHRALELARDWVEKYKPANADLLIYEDADRTPLILLDIPGELPGTILMYGHLDKQPEMKGWREDLSPWKPVMENGKLYGRGGADDGYALFASLCALKALTEQNVAHKRIVIVIEFSEESGSPDLPYYVERYADKIGSPDLVICLDSGVGNYEQFWATTSLRGIAGGTLQVDVLEEGVHSGDASGIVPSSFRILRSLLSRLEDPNTGAIQPEELHAEIPEIRREQARLAALALGEEVYEKFPFTSRNGIQTRPMGSDNAQRVLNRTWRPALSCIGQAGLPDLANGGNVLRPGTALKLSLRLPPTIKAREAQQTLGELFKKDPPLDANISYEPGDTADGWHAPPLDKNLEENLQAASKKYFGKPALSMGEGGSIPFMGMLGEKFPRAQFVITGVLGPASNAHGPNEFLHVPYAKTLTACVAEIIANYK